MPEKIALLGSTGSIGTQALEVISKYPDDFSVGILAGGNNVELLTKQAYKWLPDSVIISNKGYYKQLKENLKDTPVKVFAGEDDLEQAVEDSDVNVVLAAIVGYSGLRSTIAAVRSGKRIALANKETMVVAGEIISRLASEHGSRITPVDSEHSAIFQCLAGEENKNIEKITLTASGGPFLDFTYEDLINVRPEQALRHPNWNMGDKVTIDSASMMNKGLEVIEAKWLFNLDPGQIEVIIHPQSVIHSFVHFTDGSVKAQLGVPDMRLPILYALSYPRRLNSDFTRLDFSSYPALTFSKPDNARFRNLTLAYRALKKGGNMPCIMNAANEAAVCSFLAGNIGFLQMSDVVEYTMEKVQHHTSPDLESLTRSDIEARETANNYISKL